MAGNFEEEQERQGQEGADASSRERVQGGGFRVSDLAFKIQEYGFNGLKSKV